MEKILKILKNDIRIINVIINNFTTSSVEDELSIDIYIKTKDFGEKKLSFSKVRCLNIDGNSYGSSPISSVIIEDIEDMGWEDISYKILISEDMMTFYCKNIECHM